MDTVFNGYDTGLLTRDLVFLNFFSENKSSKVLATIFKFLKNPCVCALPDLIGRCTRGDFPLTSKLCPRLSMIHFQGGKLSSKFLKK